MAQASPTASKGPNGMEKVLNEEPRDSGFFTNDSKHTSMNSTSALTPSSGGYQSSPVNHTPSPIATNMEPTGGLPLVSPASAMSVAAMVSPTTAEHAAMGRQYESGYDTLRNSGGYMNGDSRRESVGSSVHGMDALRLNGGSPYASNNPSTSSLQETLQQQRNPGAGERPGFSSRFSNSYQPATARTPEVNGSYGRKAPAITGPTPGPIARAGEATKGHAWAFPDSDALKAPSAIHPNNNAPATGYQDSRRSSFASASSQYTTESKYPPSQRRLEDGMPADYNRLSRASSEFPGAQQHHHHQLARLQSEEASSPTGSSQPYSRTPELRVTHKLAERKRRTEMKELFERLANNLPSDGRSTKSSKWETLSKAITEIDRLKPYERMCQQLQAQLAAASQEIQSRDSKIQSLLAERHQDKQFMEQLQAQQAQLAQGPGNGYNTNHTNGNAQYNRTDAPPMADPAGRERFFPPAPPAIGPPKSTLPLRASARGVQLPSINNAVGPSYSGAQPMSGVEYASPGSGSYEQPRHQF